MNLWLRGTPVSKVLRLADGRSVYDLGLPSDSDDEPLLVIGPSGYSVERLDPDHLPPGFRWLVEDTSQ